LWLAQDAGPVPANLDAIPYRKDGGTQDPEDVEQVIAWLAEQPWCSGAVGMTGVSWGGFAALQAEGDPLSAEVECDVEVELARGDWNTRVTVESRMTCDAERFLVTTALDAYAGAARVHARRCTHEIPREGG
jgi:hypothetical protein